MKGSHKLKIPDKCDVKTCVNITVFAVVYCMLIITNMATIINDDPSLHFDIEADFYIFTPAVGCTLFGK